MTEVENKYEQRINELFKVPEHLQTNNRSLTEDMLSDQVLTGTDAHVKSSCFLFDGIPLP